MRFLLGEEALDVARMTGLALDCTRDRYGELVRFLDIKRLDWWDQLRVTLACIGVHHYLESACPPPESRSSASSSRSSGRGAPSPTATRAT